MRKWFKQPLGSGALLVAASFAANFLNFAFNAFLGRYLSFAEFGFITLINTFNYLLSVPLSALGATVNHRIAYLFAKKETNAEVNFYHVINKRLLYVAVLISILWLCFTPLLAKFFQVRGYTAIMLFTPAIYFGIISSLNGGFLKGKLMFAALAVAILIEAVTKLVAAALFVFLGANNLIYLSIPLSVVVGSLTSIYFSKKALPSPVIASPATAGRGNLSPKRLFRSFQSLAMTKHNSEKSCEPFHFPKRFFFAALISGLSTILFFTLDVILAKHYLNPTQAGEYALLSLIGKMIFFLGAMPSTFTLTLISREEGLNRNPSRMFHKIFFATLFTVLISIVALGIFGNFSIPFLFGKKTLTILPFVLPYIFGIALITLANALTSYHLARKNLIFSYASLLVTLFMAIMIFLDHKSVASFTNAIYLSGIFNFIFFVGIHYFQKNGIYVLRNLVDFVDAFTPNGNGKYDEKRVLIFNWYDIKHVWAGGAEFYIHNIAKKLVEKGYHVTIFCGNDGHCPRNEVIDGIIIKRRGGLYTCAIWGFIYYLLKYRNSYDIVIDVAKGVPFFTPLYFNKPVIGLICHIHQEMFRKGLPFPLAQLTMFLENTAMPFVYKDQQMVTISQSSKKAMENMGFGKKLPIKIVTPGADIQKSNDKKTPYPSVLYLGRLRKYKSVETLIYAIEIVKKTVPNVKLLIAGEGEDMKNLKKLANKLNLNDRVAFHGKVSEEKKAELFSEVWMSAHPSIAEGWGISIIESNMCGTPAVASNVDGLKDSVIDGKTGVLVQVGNAQQFAEAMIKILTDKGYRNSLSANCISWAQKFSWDKSTEKFCKIIKEKIK